MIKIFDTNEGNKYYITKRFTCFKAYTRFKAPLGSNAVLIVNSLYITKADWLQLFFETLSAFASSLKITVLIYIQLILRFNTINISIILSVKL